MKKVNKIVAVFLICIFMLGFAVSCSMVDLSNPGAANDNIREIPNESVIVPLTRTPAIPNFLIPVASGTRVEKTNKAIIDYSNTTDGYVMVKWLTETTKDLRVQIIGPSETKYVYTILPNDSYEVFPLSDGNGDYSVGVFEHVEGGRYTSIARVSLKVSLTDEFAPFLHPNQYVNFNRNSDVVVKAASLVASTDDLIDKVAAVYSYVIQNITYDTNLANAIIRGERPGYLPDIDSVLSSQKGICFDYAALMTAMLRSQNIPTKLVIGYADSVRHAWINVYSDETGWINNVIYFDGKEWIMMDPTFAAAAKNAAALQAFIGDGSNYTSTHLY